MTSWHAHPGFGHEVAKHGVAKPDDCREIGEGVCIRPLWHWRSDLGETEADARIMGYAIAHEVPGQEARCEGVLALKEGFGPPVWTQEGTLEGGDLTLRPSIQCKTHAEFHAFVTNGRWTGQMGRITYDWPESMGEPPTKGDALLSLSRRTGNPTGTAYLILDAHEVRRLEPVPGEVRMRYVVARITPQEAVNQAPRWEALVWHPR